MWLSHWGGSFFYRWSLFSYPLNLVFTQDLLDLQYEVELVYNAKGRKLEAYSLSLWQLESISWDLNIKKQPWMKCPMMRNSQWSPVPDELASSQATRSMPPHLWAQVRQRNHPGQQPQGEMQYITSLTFNFEIILYLYKSCQNSKESVHRLLTELPLIIIVCHHAAVSRARKLTLSAGDLPHSTHFFHLCLLYVSVSSPTFHVAVGLCILSLL